MNKLKCVFVCMCPLTRQIYFVMYAKHPFDIRLETRIAICKTSFHSSYVHTYTYTHAHAFFIAHSTSSIHNTRSNKPLLRQPIQCREK